MHDLALVSLVDEVNNSGWMLPMDSIAVAVITVLGALTGAVIGVVGSGVGQRRSLEAAQHQWTRQQQVDELARQRGELVRVLEAFILAAERAQNACDQGVSQADKSEAGARMWATCKVVGLRGSSELRNAARLYSDDLNGALWNPDGRDAWDRAWSSNQEFTRLAEAELRLLDERAKNAVGLPTG